MNKKVVSDEELLMDLKRVGKLNGNRYISMLYYDKNGKYNKKTVSTRFGSWENALKEANLIAWKDDLAGKKFGMLTAIRPTEKTKHGYRVWQCLCDCGNETFVTTGALNNRNVASCGCREGLGESLKFPERFGNAVKKGIEKQTHESGIRFMDFKKEVRSDSTTGFRGVSPYKTKSGTRYVAELTVKKERYRKAGFESEEEAYGYRLELEEKYFPEDFKQELERRKKDEKGTR